MTKPNYYLMLTAIMASIGGMLYGYDIGVISGALLFIQDSIPLTDSQLGYIVGAVLGGALIGTLCAGPIADRYGRRLLIIEASVISLLGVLVILYAHSFFLLFTARLLLGIGVGIIIVAVPLYVAEVVPAINRGKYITAFQLFLTFGIVLAYFVDLIFAPSHDWHSMFAIGLTPALVLFVGMLFLPESPRWLVSQRKTAQAEQVLRKLRQNETEIQNELHAIQASLAKTEGHWRELFSKKHWLPTLIAVLIAIFNQLTGINSFLQYAPLILKEAGLGSNVLSMMGSAGIGILNFICTIVAILLIDTVGRRPLLITGLIGVMIAEFFLGLVGFLPVSLFAQGVLSLIGLLAFILFFAIGPGVVVWLAISELFPTQVRGKGVALCLFFNSLAATLLATYFLPIVQMISMSQTYWLFTFFSFGYFLVAYFLLPETKAKTLEEIQVQMGTPVLQQMKMD